MPKIVSYIYLFEPEGGWENLYSFRCLKKGRILLANSNRWYFNSLVKKPCHETPCQCPHRLNLSFQSSRSCALPNIKVLKDKDLEFANSIRAFMRHSGGELFAARGVYRNSVDQSTQ